MKRGLSGNAVKIIALITMTLDHMGLILFPQCLWMRLVGRLAFPLYAYMIAEGCRYTKSMARYFGSVAMMGLICQLTYWFAMGSLYMCIMVTFSMSIALIALAKEVIRRKTFVWYAALAGAIVAVFFICEVLPGQLPGTDFHVDYGFEGAILPLLIYLGATVPMRLLLTGIGLVMLCMSQASGQWLCLLSLPILALYNGKRGKWNIKWLFYLYYPAHLVILYALSMAR